MSISFQLVLIFYIQCTCPVFCPLPYLLFTIYYHLWSIFSSIHYHRYSIFSLLFFFSFAIFYRFYLLSYYIFGHLSSFIFCSTEIVYQILKNTFTFCKHKFKLQKTLLVSTTSGKHSGHFAPHCVEACVGARPVERADRLFRPCDCDTREDTVGWQWNAMCRSCCCCCWSSTTLCNSLLSDSKRNICARNGAWSECKQTGISEEASFIEKFFLRTCRMQKVFFCFFSAWWINRNLRGWRVALNLWLFKAC